MFIKLIQHFGIETEVAKHLSSDYGDRAWAVASLAELSGKRWPIFGKRLSPNYPYIEAEVRYAVQREYACTAIVSSFYFFTFLNTIFLILSFKNEWKNVSKFNKFIRPILNPK